MFALPGGWRRWMALSRPIIDSEGRELWVAVAVLPMGWLSAVGVIQHVHRRILLPALPGAADLDPAAEVRRGLPFPLAKHLREVFSGGAPGAVPAWMEDLPSWFWSVYVDDFELTEVLKAHDAYARVGTVPPEVEAVRRAYGIHKLVRETDKAVTRHFQCDRKGLAVDGERGRSMPAAVRQVTHLCLTAWVIEHAACARVFLQGALGRLCADFLVRRHAFLALDRVWSEARRWNGRHRISAAAADELRLAMALTPVVFTDMRLPVDPDPMCTDASEQGGGAVIATGLTDRGRADFLEALAVPPAMVEHGVVVVELFAGIGGAARFGRQVRCACGACGRVRVGPERAADL